ncbi:(2Fe-2S)-binding protein [Lysobacter humi (ex Lee et al. 2017)]
MAAYQSSPTAMYVCICNGVTDRQIRQAAEAGCRTMSELTMRTGAGATCGSCVEMATALLDEVQAMRDLPLPVLSVAA